jgi:hypothetical protein
MLYFVFKLRYRKHKDFLVHILTDKNPRLKANKQNQLNFIGESFDSNLWSKFDQFVA